MKEMKNPGKFPSKGMNNINNNNNESKNKLTTKTLITLDVTSPSRQYQFVKWWVLSVGDSTNYIETTITQIKKNAY